MESAFKCGQNFNAFLQIRFKNRPLFTLFQSFFYQPVFQHIGDFYVICFGKGEIFKYYEKAGHLQACAEEIETLLLEKLERWETLEAKLNGDYSGTLMERLKAKGYLKNKKAVCTLVFRVQAAFIC